jgi:hypothetical protein
MEALIPWQSLFFPTQLMVYCISSFFSSSQSRYFLFARRLARFPDAWLLPLFPLFFRGAMQILRKFQGSIGSSKAQNMYATRRFYLYIVLIQIRGWVLYLVFDKIENLIVSSAGTSCWYEWLLPRHYSSCQGRVTDFSDHVVLYFAQLLPIALAEVLHSFVVPFWDTTKNASGSRNGICNAFIPVFLLVWLSNLYFVTFLGAYKTAVYFHTGPEIFTGYLISLVIQVPLFLLQCTSVFPRTREYFYGHAMS